jgi:hypothetical protein
MGRCTATTNHGSPLISVGSARVRAVVGVEMIVQVHRHDGVFYICDACGFAYRQKELAERCQSWCREHNSCSLDIIRHALFVT